MKKNNCEDDWSPSREIYFLSFIVDWVLKEDVMT